MKGNNSSQSNDPIQEFIDTFSSAMSRQRSDAEAQNFNFMLSSEEFKILYPNDDDQNISTKSDHLRTIFGHPGEAEKLILALQKKRASIPNDSDEALRKYLESTASGINSEISKGMSSSELTIAATNHAIVLAGQVVDQFSDNDLRPLYDYTIQMINQVTPVLKNESPLLYDDQINEMKEGEVLEASWMYEGYDKESKNDTKYSDFHLVKFQGKTTLFCQKKNGEVFCGEVSNLKNIHNIITNVAGIKDDERLKTEETIKKGKFISPYESSYKNIAVPIFDDPIATDLLKKLDQEVELDPFEKSLLFMISQVFVADIGISDKFKRPLNLQETKDFLRFLTSKNIDNVEDPVFRARLILSDQEKLTKIKSVLGRDSSLVAEFFQGSQFANLIQGKGFTVGNDERFPEDKEEVKQSILSGKLYCICNGESGGHYFGLVFGGEQNGRRKVYIQDSTESINEDIKESYNKAIAKIYPDLDKVDIVKTMKKIDGAKIFSNGNSSIQNQCRYSSIIGSEKVIEKLKNGAPVTENSIRYREEFFVNKMTLWFDQTPSGQEIRDYAKEEYPQNSNDPKEIEKIEKMKKTDLFLKALEPAKKDYRDLKNTKDKIDWESILSDLDSNRIEHIKNFLNEDKDDHDNAFDKTSVTAIQTIISEINNSKAPPNNISSLVATQGKKIVFANNTNNSTDPDLEAAYEAFKSFKTTSKIEDCKPLDFKSEIFLTSLDYKNNILSTLTDDQKELFLNFYDNDIAEKAFGVIKYNISNGAGKEDNEEFLINLSKEQAKIISKFAEKENANAVLALLKDKEGENKEAGCTIS